MAIDRVGARLAGLSEDQLPVVRAARRLEAFAPSLGAIEIAGDAVESLAVPDFDVPSALDLQWPRWRALRKLLKRAVATRPVVDPTRCKGCGVCAHACPPQAISVADGLARLDRASCISCFCCQEMCPQHAITIRRGWLARIVIREKNYGRSIGKETLQNPGDG